MKQRSFPQGLSSKGADDLPLSPLFPLSPPPLLVVLPTMTEAEMADPAVLEPPYTFPHPHSRSRDGGLWDFGRVYPWSSP